MTYTKLHEACMHEDIPNIILLASQHPDQAVKVDDHGLTPLHTLLLTNPSAAAVQALLKASPLSVADKDVHGDTPLHIACGNANMTKHVVKMLLDACPTSASVKNKEGLMPLHAACRYAPQNEEIMGLLIEYYPTALHSHIKIGNPAPRKSTGSSHPEKENIMMHDLMNPGAGMSAKSSIDYRFDFEGHKQIRDGAYPLHMAIANGAPLSVIEMLIKEADDVLLLGNKFGETPLHIAVEVKADDEIIETLINCAPSTLHMRDKKNGNMPIHIAATMDCSPTVIKTMLSKWPDLTEERNNDKLTPYDVALEHKNCSDSTLRLLHPSEGAVI